MFIMSVCGMSGVVSYIHAKGEWFIFPLPLRNINWVAPEEKQKLKNLYNTGFSGKIKSIKKPALIKIDASPEKRIEIGELEYGTK